MVDPPEDAHPHDPTPDATPDDAHEGGGLPTFETLRLDADGDVAVLTLDRPEARNALAQRTLLEIAAALQVVESDATVRALVLRGDGPAFCAGADLAEFAEMGDAFAGREASLAGQDVVNALAAMPIPTVAALHGAALGGGLELALACDLRVAAEDARLGLPETRLGLIPGYGGTQRLPRLIGEARALDLILTGRRIDAQEALAMGLVTRVAADATAAALEVAHGAAEGAPVALGLAKEALLRGRDGTLAQGLETEADLFALATTSEDAREGIAAFLEKRAPTFEGR